MARWHRANGNSTRRCLQRGTGSRSRTKITRFSEPLEAHTANAKKRFDVGDVPQNDFLAASVALANARQGQLQAENALDNARAAYNRFLGRPMNQPVSLDPDLGIDDLVAPAGNLEALLARARENRVELDAMAAQAVALRARSKAVRAQSRPQLALTGGYMYLENAFLTADEFWMTGVAVQWNPFDGGRNRNRAAALEKRATAMTHSRNDLDSMIALQVRRAWNDRREAESRSAVTAAAVTQAAENLRVVRNRYDAGASMNTEVLDAEALRQQALNNRDDARYGFALAQLRLARAAGEL